MRLEGDYPISFEISLEEWREITRVTDEAIASVESEHGGCIEGLQPEYLFAFSGDTGNGVEIQGCGSEKISAARDVLRSVALRYLPMR
jgi:hypothetical protein